MSEQTPPSKQWLTLGAAARRLGVHATTLRRWADNGDIPVMLTPGGHRRFSVVDIESFVQSGLRRNNVSVSEWTGRALTHTRQEIVSRQDQPWLMQLDDEVRAQHRMLGRRLLGLVFQYLSDDGAGDTILEEARWLGAKYGDIGLRNGISLSESLQASMFFHDTLLKTALWSPDNAQLKPATSLQMVHRINAILTTIHLAITEVYDARNTDRLLES